MSYLGLKLLACITMLADHLSLGFPTYFDWLDALCGDGYRVPFFRIIGRVAFPLFAFLIANGLKHTRDERKYALRLVLLSVISEIPFNLLVSGRVVHFGSVNVVFTLLIGLVCLSLHRSFREKYRHARLFSAITLVLGCVCAICLSSDYSYIGVLTVFLFGVFDIRVCRHRCILTLLLSALLVWKSACVPVGMQIYTLCGVNVLSLPIIGKVFSRDIWPLWVRLFSLAALIPIFTYNESMGLLRLRASTRRTVKLLLNGFYPLHMVLLYWIFRL